MSVIIFKAEIKAGTGLKQGTGSKTKLMVQVSSGTEIGNKLRHHLEQKNNH